jgi:hypothetical protein
VVAYVFGVIWLCVRSYSKVLIHEIAETDSLKWDVILL